MGNKEYVLSKCAKIMDKVPGDNIIGVEVGVFAAQLSSTILPAYPRLRKLYGIDPYTRFIKRDAWPQSKWDNLYEDVQRVMSVHGDRWELIRKTSLTAAQYLPDNLDFVYLDGDHSAIVVEREIPLYEAKIKDGGLLCGHDYVGNGEPGVKPTVDEFARLHGRDLHVDELENMWWWIVKKIPVVSRSMEKRIAIMKSIPTNMEG